MNTKASKFIADTWEYENGHKLLLGMPRCFGQKDSIIHGNSISWYGSSVYSHVDEHECKARPTKLAKHF